MKQLYLIGRAPGYTLSPQIHSAACSAFNLSWQYKVLPVENFNAAMDKLVIPECIGANVTIPYKTECNKYLDWLDPLAVKLGAVNTIVHRQNRLLGFNTDAPGLARDLARLGISASGKRVNVLGAGGAAAAVLAVLENPSNLTIISRRRQQASALRERMQMTADLLPWDTLVLPQADLTFVCTPPGCWQRWQWKSNELIYNLNYYEDSMPTGNHVSGLGMLVYQAAESFTLWSGYPAPVEPMAAAVGLNLTP